MRRWASCLGALGVAWWGCAGAPPPYAYEPVIHPADAPMVAAEDEPVRLRPAVEAEVLAGVVSRHRRALSRCHVAADAPIRVDVELDIAKEGAVTDARVSAPSLEIASCVKQTTERWRFPKSNVDSLARFPLVFQPAEE